MKSSDYSRRRKQIIKARILLMIVLLSLVVLVLGLSVLEWYTLFNILDEQTSVRVFLEGIFAYIIFSFLISVCISRISLHVVYFFEHAKVALAFFSVIFCVMYFFTWTQFSDGISLLYLGVSKVSSFILCLRFWDMLLSELRLQTRLEQALQAQNSDELNKDGLQKLKWAQKIPKDFLRNWRDFSVCKWVTVGCLFLNLLGFVMAMCSHSSIGLIQGWDGLVLIALYFSVFLVFLRNPGGSTQTS
jgi:hypothetical protein